MSISNNMLKVIMKSVGCLKMTISGTSMLPIINDGDNIHIEIADIYDVGDILLFYYGNYALAHRLIKKVENVYFCKGDNTFKIEDIEYDQIIGKVVFISSSKYCYPPPPRDKRFYELSWKIGQSYMESGLDYHAVVTTPIFTEYKNNYL